MLQYHSVISTNLVNALLVTYFFGSDNFFEALKYGVFPSMSLDNFLLMIGVVGLLIFIGGTYLFKTMKKDKGSIFTSGMAKGLLLKKNVELYIVLLAVFLGVMFLLAITMQQYSQWGSIVLSIILFLNLLIPVVAISLINSEAMKKSMGKPSKTDEFLMKKGSSGDLDEAQTNTEFWLLLFSFAIIIGISQMLDENATIMAENNSGAAAGLKRAY